MALINDNQVEEIARVFPVQARAMFIAGNRLVSGKIHLAAFGRVAFNLVQGIAERSEYLDLRLIHEDISIG